MTIQPRNIKTANDAAQAAHVFAARYAELRGIPASADRAEVATGAASYIAPALRDTFFSRAMGHWANLETCGVGF